MYNYGIEFPVSHVVEASCPHDFCQHPSNCASVHICVVCGVCVCVCGHAFMSDFAT